MDLKACLLSACAAPTQALMEEATVQNSYRLIEWLWQALSGNRAGQHSIRINAQFRLCFRWADGCAHDVEIVDYH